MSGAIYSVSDISFNVVRGDGESTVEYHIVRHGNYIAARCWDYTHAIAISAALNKLEAAKRSHNKRKLKRLKRSAGRTASAVR
jgi:hypothetical protein